MSIFSTILKHSSQSVAAGVFSAVGSFAAAVIVARLLGVEGTATVSMALWIVFLTTTLADFGISGCLARFVAEGSRDGAADEPRRIAAYALRAFLLAIAAGLLLSGAFLWFYWGDIQSKYSTGHQQAQLFCALVMLCFVVHMLNSFAYQFLRGQRAFKAIAVYSLLGTVLQISGVALGSHLYGADGALVGYIVFSLPMVFALRRVPVTGPLLRPAVAPRMRSYAISFYVSALFSPLLWVRSDLLIVDQMVGANGVGLFAAASTIAALVLQVCQMVCNALLPNIVHAADGDRKDFEDVSRVAVRLALTLLIPACLIAAAAAPEAISVIFGPAFAPGGMTAAILCLAGAGSALSLVVASVLNADEANAILARNGVAGAVLTIASGIALVLSFGLIGAALGRLVAQGSLGLLNARSANRRVARLITMNWIVRIGLAGGFGALVTEVIGWLMEPGAVSLFLSLAAGGLTYLLLAVLILPLTSEDRDKILAQLESRPAILKGSADWLLRLRGML